jgi:RepB DNA-primase from phage plasmid
VQNPSDLPECKSCQAPLSLFDQSGGLRSAQNPDALLSGAPHADGGDVMPEADPKAAHHEARHMLDTFASVGANHFDLTLTTAAGDKVLFRRGVPRAELAQILPDLLDAAIRRRRNVIVRPHSPGVTFIQLDDLAAPRLPPLAPAVFLTLETSPGNFQAWLALPGREDKELARRVRRGSDADATASGATRIAGSRNFKDKYAPDFPHVMIRKARAGYRTNVGDLERLGLVAPPEEFAALPVAPARPIPGRNRTWPNYAHALDRAPPDTEGRGPDRSLADFVWCMTAITWGFNVAETAERLIAESSKARANGNSYAVTTARNAAHAVQRRRWGRRPDRIRRRSLHVCMQGG